MSNLVTGLFDSESLAESAVTQLHTLGYSQSEISIIMKDRSAAQELAAGTGSHAMEGVGTGAAIGGTIGAVLAGLLAVGSVTIPGIGLLAAGPLAAMLAGAGAGGLAGSLLGWLVGAGVPDDVAPYYERGLTEGGVVVAVAAHTDDEGRVQQVLQGGAVAYAGNNTQSYVSPHYAARHTDLALPLNNPTGSWNATNEAQRTNNSLGAEVRSAERTAAEHGREERRDVDRTNPILGTIGAITNEADRTKTALENQTDKVSIGARNTTDRLTGY